MPTIPGYHITEQLYESAHSQIYRVRRIEDDRPVILKILQGEFPASEDMARFRREYAITSNLRLEGVIEAYRLVSYQNTLLMELEDFGGEALPRILPPHPLELAELLRLAMRIADILGRVHQQQIMHKDINPANIVWNPATDQLKIIDFGICPANSRKPGIRKFWKARSRICRLNKPDG